MDKSQIKHEILKKYKKVSESPKGLFKFQTGKTALVKFGYDSEWVESLQSKQTHYFCGVGNTIDIAAIEKDAKVLDFGCGAGVDVSYLASKVSDPKNIVGLDISEAMLTKAKQLFPKLTFRHSDDSRLPFDDASFDIITANGSINLVPQKDELFAEMFRVLKPIGRLQFADMVLKEQIPQSEISAKLWSD